MMLNVQNQSIRNASIVVTWVKIRESASVNCIPGSNEQKSFGSWVSQQGQGLYSSQLRKQCVLWLVLFVYTLRLVYFYVMCNHKAGFIVAPAACVLKYGGMSYVSGMRVCVCLCCQQCFHLSCTWSCQMENLLFVFQPITVGRWTHTLLKLSPLTSIHKTTLFLNAFYFLPSSFFRFCLESDLPLTSLQSAKTQCRISLKQTPWLHTCGCTNICVCLCTHRGTNMKQMFRWWRFKLSVQRWPSPLTFCLWADYRLTLWKRKAKTHGSVSSSLAQVR